MQLNADFPQARTPRPTREEEQREETWKPSVGLPEVPGEPGWAYRWIRSALYGERDTERLMRSREEGWMPCTIEDFPQYLTNYGIALEGKQFVEIRGLMLHRMPESKERARTRYYDALSESQVSREALDRKASEDDAPKGRHAYMLPGEFESTVRLGHGNQK